MQRFTTSLCLLAAVFLLACGIAVAGEEGVKPIVNGKSLASRKKIVFIAGPQSHGYAEHEHYAGCLLLAKCLKEGLPNVETVVCKNGWPRDAQVLDDADAIVVYANGEGGHPDAAAS